MGLSEDLLEPIPDSVRIPGGPTHRLKRLPETYKSQPEDLPLRPGVIGTGGGVDIQRPTASPLPAKPNRTEQAAAALLRLPPSTQFEGRSFEILDGTHSYTPDWWDPISRTAVEVKAERIHSRDSRILFDAARFEFPSVTWIWARKRKTGKKGPRWEIEIYNNNQ